MSPASSTHSCSTLKFLQQSQWRTFDQGTVFLRGYLPAPMPKALQQEYIVRIEMRADSAAFGCVAHHQVVEPRVRDKVELFASSAPFGRK